ncbi:MAG: TlpA family protein disulfide reductase [Cyclobacteriaceae bacterium]
MKAVIIIACLIASQLLTANAQVVKNYSLRNIDNELVSLHDLKGESVTVIDFWTTWCKPCKKAIPELNKIFSSYQDKGVQIIGVSCDGPRTVAKVPGVSSTLQIQYPVLIDVNSDISNSLNISSFPTLIIMDQKNKIRYIHEGFTPGDEEEIVAAIEKQLNK